MIQSRYRGRLAPSPTGYLHLGHARTFWSAQARARERGGALVLRNEDLDPVRSRPEFTAAMVEDLTWFGFEWQEGPDCGGPFGPYSQSERGKFYQGAFEKLLTGGLVYPCRCSRKDVLSALHAPHQGEEDPIYPGTCRHAAVPGWGSSELERLWAPQPVRREAERRSNWRFRVPDGETISFPDGCQGPQAFAAGRDFGDFVIWRHDGVPAYQLAVVADDGAMEITEVVRGADLLLSTARQILLFRALGLVVPDFFHCPLLTDETGVRLAKRHEALSLRALKARGDTPAGLRAQPSFGAR